MDRPLSSRLQAQEAARKHANFHKAYREWIDEAIKALKPWEDGEMTLQHAVGAALLQAYEAGRRGEYPEPVEYIAKTRRVARAAHVEPETKVGKRVSRKTS